MPIHRRPGPGPTPPRPARRARAPWPPGRRSAGGAINAVLAALGLVGVALAGPGAGAAVASTTRDVEVITVDDAPSGLAVAPAIAVDHDVVGDVEWPVAVTNGGPVAVEVALAVRLAVPDAQGAPSAGAIVDWAALPRDELRLAPGERADATVLLTPPADALPAAVALVVATTGSDVREARAITILLPPGHDPGITVSLDGATATVASSGLAVVDVAIGTSAPPRRSQTTTFGPLVVFGDHPRTLRVAPVTSPFGTSTTVVVGRDGVEVARATVEAPNWPARALGIVAALAVVGTLGLAVRRARA